MKIEIAKIISEIGDTKIIFFLLILISIILFFVNKKRYFYMIASSIISSLGIVFVLKNIFKIPRPISSYILEEGYRFPSGHATANAVFMILMIYFSYKYIKNKCLKYLIYVFAFLWCLIVSYSRIILEVHIPIDIILGIFIGICCSVASIKFFIDR